MLGILIGVTAVIAMLALGAGAKESMAKSLSALGSNLLIIRPGSHEQGGVALETGAVSRFNFKDIESLKNIPKITGTSAIVNGKAQVIFIGNNCNTSINGVSVEYARLHAIKYKIGRFFTESELQKRDRVAVIGMTVVRNIFGDTNPVGKTIKINRINFRVVGVMEERGATGFRDQDDIIYIPITTAMYRLLGKDYLDSMEVEIKDQDSFATVKESITKVIYKNHKINEKVEKAIEIRNMQDIQNTMSQVTKTMTMLLGFISGLSLLVGGIGIMNIMLVSVTERTREIGLRKALGATNYDIMIQFLIESIILSLSGGFIGILLGIGIANGLSIVANWATKITLNSIILASLFSIFVGVFFGIWPAKKASTLDPIEALRYE
jgi:macrolide transport system ATP-binding/permease protein